MTAHRHPALLRALDAVEAEPSGAAVPAVFDLAAILAAPDGDRGGRATWAGRPLDELMEDGASGFRKGSAAGLRYEAWDLVKAHQRRGHTVLVVAATTRDRVAPVAEELGIENVLAAELELADGRLTGRAAPLVGEAKLAAIERFAAGRGVDLSAGFAYASRDADAELLERVAHPVALSPEPSLAAVAADRGWTTIETFDRRADALGVARTVASYGGFLASTGVGIAAGLLGRRRRTGVDAMTRTFARLGPALSGVGIDVRGSEHLRSHRPAVFLINHQSHLVDAIVSFRLLRDGFTVVAKKEVRTTPVIGQATWLADWAYVDRVGDKAQARAAIQDAVDKLQAGVSVILAPEGTRSPGPRPGPFKKGAFYMAREAGVPVVPIVMRNTGELMWRNGRALKPGTVDVVVHPPIPCDWSDEEMGDRVAEVRQLFVDTLESWPNHMPRETT